MHTKTDCLTTIAQRLTAHDHSTDPGREYDLEAIAYEYHRHTGTWDISTLEPAQFWQLAHRHSTLDYYRPELTAPTAAPPTGRVAIGTAASTAEHDLRLVNLNGLDVALDLTRLIADHTDTPTAGGTTATTDDLAALIAKLRCAAGDATEAVLIVALRELITSYLPHMLDPAATAEALIELSDHNNDRTPGTQVPYLRNTRRHLPGTNTGN